MSEKQKTIHDVYFDKAGFGSKSRTLAEALEKDKAITMGGINEFFRKNSEQKRKPVGQNSFTAPHSTYEYQMDPWGSECSNVEVPAQKHVSMDLDTIMDSAP